CTSQGSYDASLQNTIAAFRAGKQPTIAQVSDAGTLDIMLSGAEGSNGVLQGRVVAALAGADDLVVGLRLVEAIALLLDTLCDVTG
ncbi:hypothetical protein ACC736_38375, partial [Rhizobium ruizarguesonis]